MVTAQGILLVVALVLFSGVNVLSWGFSPLAQNVYPAKNAWTVARLQPLSVMSEEQSVEHAITSSPKLPLQTSSNKSSSNNNKFFIPRPWRRFLRNRRAKMAYRMAVLARLAYYPFYERLVADELFGTAEDDRSSFHAFQVTVRRRFRLRFLWCKIRCGIAKLLLRSMTTILERPPQKHHSISHHDQTKACTDWLNKRAKEADKHQYTLHYSLYGWTEPTPVPGVTYHDTDLIVATSNDNKTLVIAFAGTESAADHATNIQTFEPIEHSGMFHGGIIRHGSNTGNNSTSFLEGSIHRGFLNAYSRVEQGGVLSLSPAGSDLTYSLDRRFGHCRLNDNKMLPTLDQLKHQIQDSENLRNNLLVSSANGISSSFSSSSLSEESLSSEPSVKESTQLESNGACRVEGESLMAILRELTTEALLNGKTVHLSGHSLGPLSGGGLATLAALDIIINFPDVPVSKLHLWTFGAPQVADDIFLQSAVDAVPRLRFFVEGKNHFHRFVTLSDDCEVDFVSTVTERALPSPKRGFRGRFVRQLGGLQGSPVHFTDPHYLFTSDQRDDNTRSETPILYKTDTSTAIDAHAMYNYLEGISRESFEYPLLTDLPLDVRQWMGEDINREAGSGI